MARTRVPAQPANAERNPVTVVLTLVVLAALAVVTALASPFVRASAAAPLPRHVAVVVAGIGSACLNWKSGFTAADALERVAEPTMKKGRVVQLNGRPSTAKKHPDGQWAYWRVVDGAWTRASTSSADTKLAAGGTDGWTYSTKGAAATRPPSQSATKTYASLCGASDKAAEPTKGAGGNGIAIILSPSNPAPSKASGHAAGGSSAKPKPKPKTGAKSKTASKSTSSTAGPNSSPESDVVQSPSDDTVSGSDAAAPSDDASPSTAKSSGSAKKSGATTAAASPVASDKDAGGPGLGLATGALLVLLVGGGTALYVVRRRLTGGAKS